MLVAWIAGFIGAAHQLLHTLHLSEQVAHKPRLHLQDNSQNRPCYIAPVPMIVAGSSMIWMTKEKAYIFCSFFSDLRWYMLISDTKKPPVGGFIESRKMFSGTSPEGENCSQAIFTTANLLEVANTSRSFHGQYTSRQPVCNLCVCVTHNFSYTQTTYWKCDRA